MPLYDKCQKTLVVDGKIDRIPEDWQAVQVPRFKGKFCWGRMWDAGVYSARHERIWYLDSDRLLPKDYLLMLDETIKEDRFVYSSAHYQMKLPVSLESCKELLEINEMTQLLSHRNFKGNFTFEPRCDEMRHGSGKNVMSGNTAFTKGTFMKLGGVDHWYCGHGAFADSDFHTQAAINSCEFLDLGATELHYLHAKKENGVDLEDEELHQLALDNFIYYCDKWSLPICLAENLAIRSGICSSFSYIDDQLQKIKLAKGS